MHKMAILTSTFVIQVILVILMCVIQIILSIQVILLNK